MMEFIPYKESSIIERNQIIFLGLSYKCDHAWNVLEAFSDKTRSGKLIQEIQQRSNIPIIMRNLVLWVPLDSSWKIRYPNKEEKIRWLAQFLEVLNTTTPKAVFIFWKEVLHTVLSCKSLEKISENTWKYWITRIFYCTHPSYIMQYRRDQKEEYIESILWKLKDII